MQLGLENKKQTTWAVVLGVVAILAVAYEFLPMFFGSSPTPSSSAQAAAPTSTRATTRTGARGKKVRPENLDPTLRLDLLASAEQTQYEGSGRNIFVSEAEPVKIPPPVAPGSHGRAQSAASLRHAAAGSATATDSAEVFRLRQQSGRTEESISLAGWGRFRGGRGRDCEPAIQGDPHFAHIGRDAGHGEQRAAAEYSADAGVRAIE